MGKKRVNLISFNYANHFSLALGYLKSYAEKEKCILQNTEIAIVDFDAEIHDVRQVVYYLSQSKPDIIGFSCFCWSINKILETARVVKMIFPHIKTPCERRSATSQSVSCAHPTRPTAD